MAVATAEPTGDIATKQSEAEAVQSEISSLNMSLEAKVERFNYANSELEQTVASIKENEAKLAEAMANLQVAQDRMEKRIVGIYRNGSVEVLDLLMETSDISEFLSKYDMLAKLSEQDLSDVEQIQQLKAETEAARVKLDSDRANQESLVAELEEEKAYIEAGLEQRKQLLSSIQGDIATLQQIQAEEQARREAAFQASIVTAAESYGADESTPAPPPMAAGGDVVSIAMQYLGVPYVWGGTSPSGFDCSGLVQYVYAQVGISLPRVASAQYGAGQDIGYSELAPGDLVFYGSPAYHVAIYIGGGQIIHAPFEGEVVQIAPISGGGSSPYFARVN